MRIELTIAVKKRSVKSVKSVKIVRIVAKTVVIIVIIAKIMRKIVEKIAKTVRQESTRTVKTDAIIRTTIIEKIIERIIDEAPGSFSQRVIDGLSGEYVGKYWEGKEAFAVEKVIKSIERMEIW